MSILSQAHVSYSPGSYILQILKGCDQDVPSIPHIQDPFPIKKKFKTHFKDIQCHEARQKVLQESNGSVEQAAKLCPIFKRWAYTIQSFVFFSQVISLTKLGAKGQKLRKSSILLTQIGIYKMVQDSLTYTRTSNQISQSSWIGYYFLVEILLLKLHYFNVCFVSHDKIQVKVI